VPKSGVNGQRRCPRRASIPKFDPYLCGPFAPAADLRRCTANVLVDMLLYAPAKWAAENLGMCNLFCSELVWRPEREGKHESDI
jgi:hypothetical protein